MKKWMINIMRVMNVILYLIIVATWISIPEVLTLNVSLTIFNLAFTAALLFQARKELEYYYTSSQFKNLMTYGLSAVLLFGVLGMLNYLAFKNPIPFDLTNDKKNSITKQSQKIVQKLAKPLEVKIFARKSNFGPIRMLLDLYRFEKNDINYDFIDIELRPGMAKQYSIQKIPTLVFEYEDKKQYVSNMQELAITNALIKLTREETPLIYYSVGHDELDLGADENEGGKQLQALINRSDWKVHKINLSMISEIPDAVKTLIIWGPKTGFFKQEIEVIDRYLKRGGNLMLALDPSIKEDKIANLRKYMKKWGFNILNNFVIDRLKHINGSNGSVPVVHTFDQHHPITREMKPPVFFPLASSVAKVDNEDTAVEILARSTPFPASWAENTPKEFLTGKLTFAENEDFKGPVGYFGVRQTRKDKTKIVAFGNSSFVINSYAKFPKNFMLFLNSLSWLADDGGLISFNNPVIQDQPVFIGTSQLGIIFYFSVLFAPMVLFAFGIFVYRRRLKL